MQIKLKTSSAVYQHNYEEICSFLTFLSNYQYLRITANIQHIKCMQNVIILIINLTLKLYKNNLFHLSCFSIFNSHAPRRWRCWQGCSRRKLIGCLNSGSDRTNSDISNYMQMKHFRELHTKQTKYCSFQKENIDSTLNAYIPN